MQVAGNGRRFAVYGWKRMPALPTLEHMQDMLLSAMHAPLFTLQQRGALAHLPLTGSTLPAGKHMQDTPFLPYMPELKFLQCGARRHADHAQDKTAVHSAPLRHLSGCPQGVPAA